MFDRYAKVVFSLPLDGEFTYRIPHELNEKVEPGVRVEVELRGRSETAIVTGIESTIPDFETLDIGKVLDDSPLVNETQMGLAWWMADQYMAGPGECLFRMFPSGKRRPARKEYAPGSLSPGHRLNEEQQRVFDLILKTCKEKPVPGADSGENLTHIHLLHGVTGAGKTEVYIHLILEAWKRGRGAILLVPEISLTYQLIRKLQGVFGDALAVLHSGLKGSDRFGAYISVLRGERKLAIGTRSAIFTPVVDPGIIIVDEEHDSSFKEHQSPRYDARQIALKRARDTGAVVVFGSATPRVETTFHARRGEPVGGFLYHYHRISGRATGASLPRVQIIKSPPADIPFSPALALEIDRNLKKNEQSLLLLNRRGYAPFLFCEECGKSVTCPSCSVTLTLHRGGSLVCHYCGHREQESHTCPDCGGKLKRIGSGTQKLEEYLMNLHPGIRLERVDTDSVHGNTNAKEALELLIDGKLDLLLGTQMIAKGIDAPGVTLVGVLQSDHHLGLPDFRASERTFALLTQVAGRAGRSHLPGRVIFEAMRPEEKTLAYAAAQDYDSFYEEELQLRREFAYPPFSRLTRFVFRAKEEEQVKKVATDFGNLIRNVLEGLPETRILGPVSPPLEKLNDQFRVHIIIKTGSQQKLRRLVQEPVKKTKASLPKDVYLEIDFDPVNLL